MLKTVHTLCCDEPGCTETVVQSGLEYYGIWGKAKKKGWTSHPDPCRLEVTLDYCPKHAKVHPATLTPR
jgi:hypothetical protein